MINLLISYFAMASGLVSLTYTSPGWTVPPIISGVLATGDIKASILQLICVIIDILIYLPFISMIEKNFQKEEQL